MDRKNSQKSTNASSGRTISVKRILLSLILIAGGNSALSAGGNWTVSWWTVDSGGEILMTDPTGQSSFELSGTLGQWDATNAEGSVSGSWELTGGFWSVSISGTDFLFSDGFEDPDFSR